MSVNFTEVLFAVLGTTEVRVNERIGSTLPTQKPAVQWFRVASPSYSVSRLAYNDSKGSMKHF